MSQHATRNHLLSHNGLALADQLVGLMHKRDELWSRTPRTTYTRDEVIAIALQHKIDSVNEQIAGAEKVRREGPAPLESLETFEDAEGNPLKHQAWLDAQNRTFTSLPPEGLPASAREPAASAA